MAEHLEMDILHPQAHAFEAYYNSDHAKTIKSVQEEYEKLTDDVVTWRIIPSVAEPFTVFFGTHDM